MNRQHHLQDYIVYWQDKAKESLEAAEAEFNGGRYNFAVNRLYYACFYVITANFLKNDIATKKHPGLRAAFHRYFVKTGKVKIKHGKLFDELFEARQRGDYLPLVFFGKEEVAEWLTRSREFVNDLIALLNLP